MLAIGAAAIFMTASWNQQRTEQRQQAIAAEQTRRRAAAKQAEAERRQREQEQRERDPSYQARQRQIAKEAEDRSLQIDVGSLCQFAIRQQLNDPRSAEFDFVLTYRWQRNPNNKVLMFPTLRAANAFGGTIRASFACEVDISDRKNLRITHLSQL